MCKCRTDIINGVYVPTRSVLYADFFKENTAGEGISVEGAIFKNGATTFESITTREIKPSGSRITINGATFTSNTGLSSVPGTITGRDAAFTQSVRAQTGYFSTLGKSGQTTTIAGRLAPGGGIAFRIPDGGINTITRGSMGLKTGQLNVTTSLSVQYVYTDRIYSGISGKTLIEGAITSTLSTKEIYAPLRVGPITAKSRISMSYGMCAGVTCTFDTAITNMAARTYTLTANYGYTLEFTATRIGNMVTLSWGPLVLSSSCPTSTNALAFNAMFDFLFLPGTAGSSPTSVISNGTITTGFIYMDPASYVITFHSGPFIPGPIITTAPWRCENGAGLLGGSVSYSALS